MANPAPLKGRCPECMREVAYRLSLQTYHHKRQVYYGKFQGTREERCKGGVVIQPQLGQQGGG